VALELLLLALLAGAVVPLQASFNAALARHAGRVEWAAFASFVVGTTSLGLWLVARRAALPDPSALARAPWWAWAGGLLGAFYVSAITLATPRLGVAVTLGVSIAGTMLASLALDATGALGLTLRPITGTRLLGAALLVAGVLLVRR